MTKKLTPDFSTDWLISHFRWVWTVIIFVLLYFNPLSTEIPGSSTLNFIPLIGLVYNFFVVVLLLLKWYPNWLSMGVTFLDTALALTVMWVSGGHQSAFNLLILLFPVTTAVGRFSPEMGLLITVLPATITYAISIIVKNDLATESLVKVGAEIVTLFGIGSMVGFISQANIFSRTRADKAEIRDLRVKNERAKAIYEMANTLSSTLNYHTVLNAMVELAYLALAEASGLSDAEHGNATVGMVLLFDDDNTLGKLRIVSSRNIPRHDEDTTVSAKEGILAKIVYKAEATVGNDAMNDPILKNFMALQKCHSVVGAPLRAGFDIYGVVLFAHPQKNMYTEEHATLLTTFCNQAIIPLQNAQLYADLEQEQKKLLEKEAQSRRELARNLHDGPTQAVSALAMRLNFIQILLKKEGLTEKAFDELSKMEQIALRTTKEIRQMLFTLRPIVLETQGLSAALKQFADRLSDLHSLSISLDVDSYSGKLSTEKEGLIFTIIEEAAGNARKYAGNSEIEIRLHESKQRIVAEVVDHGPGFDVDAVKASYDQRGSLGLVNMEERAQMIGGTCAITSVKGKGTTVRIDVPLTEK